MGVGGGVMVSLGEGVVVYGGVRVAVPVADGEREKDDEYDAVRLPLLDTERECDRVSVVVNDPL